MKKRLLLLFVIGSLLLSTKVYSALPWKKYEYFQNWGGLNDNLSSTEIADNEASDLQNVVFDTGGAIKKRDGFSFLPDEIAHTITDGTGCVVTGLYFYKDNNNARNLIAIGNQAAKAVAYKKTYDVGGGVPSGTWTIIDGSGNLPQTGYADANLVSFTTAENKAVFAMPSTSGSRPFKWTTGDSNLTTLTANTLCPEASLVVYHKNHLFTNDTDNPSRIWFSNLDDITAWTATDFIDVQTNDGTKVRGLVSALDSLYIWKDRSIWRLSGNERDTWYLQKMIDGVGTLSHQSIAVLSNGIYFTTSQNEIVRYNGAYTVDYISVKISNTIGDLNFSRSPYNLGSNFEDSYYVATSTAGVSTNNRVLLYDTGFNAWTKFVGINANAWTICDDNDAVGSDSLCFGDYNGYVSQYPSGDYNDTTGIDITTTKLLAHSDGTDASTTFTDSSSYAKTITANGDAQIDTAQSKFGTASGLFDGTGDYLSVPDSTDWDFGTGDFTLDLQVRFNAVTGVQPFLSQAVDANNYWFFKWDASEGLHFKAVQVDGTGIDIVSSAATWTPSADTWYHIALVRSGSGANTIKLYVDGISKTLTSDGWDRTTCTALADELFLGTYGAGLSGSRGYFNGWIDELRVSKGIARWTADFTPPTDAYNLSGSDVAINAYYQTKWFRYPDISLGDKYWRVLKLYHQSETTDNTFLTAEAKSDYQTSGRTFNMNLSQAGSLWDSMTWDKDVWTGTTLVINRQEVEKGKTMFQLKVSNALAGEGFTVYGWEFFIEPTDRD